MAHKLASKAKGGTARPLEPFGWRWHGGWWALTGGIVIWVWWERVSVSVHGVDINL